MLHKVLHGQELSLEEATQLDNNTVNDMIRRDPVSCARYLEHRVDSLMAALKQVNGFFGKNRVEDEYVRIEFQDRGSPHQHGVVYNADAPKYRKDPIDVVIAFIDSYITCANDTSIPYLVLQKHRHTFSCYKGKGKTKRCRFGIPLPVMPRTMEVLYKNPVDQSFEEILEELKCSEADYVLAIRSSIKRDKVFTRRRSMEVGMNAYNADMLKMFEANMDIQFVLDEYAVLSYLLKYVTKAEDSVSKLMRQAAKDVRASNRNLVQELCTYSNIFLNSSMTSAQEALYNCLSMKL